MNPSWRLALLLPLACAAACSEPIQTDTDTDPDACVPAATLPAATCAEGVLSRHEAPTQLRSGPATVTRLDAEPGGRTNMTLDADGVTTILSLPAAPTVAVGDTLAVEIDPLGAIVLRDEGRLVAYIGRLAAASSTAPVDFASLIEANREGAPVSIEVAGLSLTLEPACGGWVAHHGATYGCPDVPLVAFSVRHGDTTVLPGERAIAPLDDGLALAIENRSVHVRESPSCGECADFWGPSFRVTLVMTPSPVAPGTPAAE